MNNIEIKSLREKYPTFSYDSYSWQLTGSVFTASWEFTSGDKKYHPTTQIDFPETIVNQDKNSLDTLVFNLGLSKVFSYWKATISPTVIIKAGYLDEAQITWWEKLHLRGMGQFFYENDISDFVNSFHWQNDSDKVHDTFSFTTSPDTNLVMLGGGKDSTVTTQLLQEKGIHMVGFVLNPISAVKRVADITPLTEIITATRTIDPTLIQLNTQGFPNGHIPFSANLAFYGHLIAYLRGCKTIIVSNEASSEEGNVEYQDFKINHQYSKTLEFEKDFQQYSRQYLTPDITYFSFLRPLYELQISGLFARYPQYFMDFRSCNIGQKTDSWCGSCPKCLSIYLLLGAFIGPVAVSQIFGTDILDNSSLLPVFKDMIEEGHTRPFECIGTRVETIVAASMMSKKYQTKLPLLLQYFADDFLSNNNLDIDAAQKSILGSFNNHSMPDTFSAILKQSLPIKLQ